MATGRARFACATKPSAVHADPVTRMAAVTNVTKLTPPTHQTRPVQYFQGVMKTITDQMEKLTVASPT